MIYIFSNCLKTNKQAWLQSAKTFAEGRGRCLESRILYEDNNISSILCRLTPIGNKHIKWEADKNNNEEVVFKTSTNDKIVFSFQEKSFKITSSPGSPQNYFYTSMNGFFECSTDLRFFSSQDYKLSQAAIKSVFKYGAIPSPLSLYTEVNSLASGFVLKADDKINVSKNIVYKPPNEKINDENTAINSIKNELDSILSNTPDRSVLFFSGGVDSSLLAARLSKLGKRPVLLHFSFGKDDSETKVAEKIASHLSLEFHSVPVTDESYLPFFKSVAYHYALPFGDASSLPTWVMLQYAAQKFPNIDYYLEGTAADGIFAVGNKSQPEKVLEKLPSVLAKGISIYYRHTAAWKHNNLISKAGRFLRENELDNNPARRLLMQNSLDGLSYHISDEIQSDIIKSMDLGLFESVKNRSVSEIISYADITHVCAGIYAQKSLSPAEYFNKKVFFPFLNESMVEFTFSINKELNHKFGEKKYLLKKILAENLPDNFIYRKKAGFRPPLQSILSLPTIREFIERNVINTDNILFTYVNKSITIKMIRYALKGKLTNKEALNYVWSFIFFSLWLQD